MQTSVDNTVNDLRYENKFENHVKEKNNFFIKRNIAFLFSIKYILFLETYFLKIPKNLLASADFLPRQILKNVDMPRRISIVALVKLIDWII